MIPLEQIRAARCPTCGARPGQPCVVHVRPIHNVHAFRRHGVDQRCPTCKARPGEACVAPADHPAVRGQGKLVRITAGVEVHPSRWEIAAAAYARVTA